jgi:cell division protein FtsB
MKAHSIIIGVAAVLIVCLSGVVISQDSQLGSAANALSAEKARNAELQSKVASLEQEVAALKETADYYFQSGVDQQSAGNLQEAKTAFEAVVARFPTSSLVGSAQQRLTAVNEAIAKAEADRYAEMQRRAEEKEKQAREQGEPIDYSLFYAKAKSTGLPIGKRFRFRAKINHDLHLSVDSLSLAGMASLDKLFVYTHAAFDDEAQYERFLQGPDNWPTHTIVASMGYNGRVQIHRIE